MIHATHAIDDACSVIDRWCIVITLSMMMHAIYSIYLHDAQYICYRSVTMNDNMLSIYYAISTMHSIIMVLYAKCYLSWDEHYTNYRSMMHTVMLHAMYLTIGDTCYRSATQTNDLLLMQCTVIDHCESRTWVLGTLTCHYTRIIVATNQFTSTLHIEDVYVDKSSSTTILLTLWTIVYYG